MPSSKKKGFTLIELLVVMAIVALLASLVAPSYFRSLDRSKETALRASLETVRDAIDQYAADKGALPDSLEQLKEARYINRVPEDPLAPNGAWVTVAPPPDASVRGALYDIRSSAPGRGSDGRLYADW